jgi:hypothetical protein
MTVHGQKHIRSICVIRKTIEDRRGQCDGSGRLRKPAKLLGWPISDVERGVGGGCGGGNESVCVTAGVQGYSVITI